ncbi:MAG: hypothetical protein EA351_07115 [Gemmatimonadales bacterium]|nr:MAG: hypothetical protein EA351_07115 [Gemmatimonadales bacterium]
MIELIVPPLQRWLLYSGTILVAGITAWRFFIAPGAAAHLDEDGPRRMGALEGRVAGIGAWVVLALLPVWGLRLYVQLLGFRDPFAPLAEDLAYLVFETFWGSVWMGQGGVIVALAGVFFWISRHPAEQIPARVPWGTTPAPPPLPRRWKLAGAGVLLLALSLALSSHAMSVPSNRPLAVGLDAAHVLAAGSWIGALVLILAVRDRGSRPARESGVACATNPASGADSGSVAEAAAVSSLLAAQLRAFSPVAMVSVGVLLFAGFILSTQHVGTWSNLWGSQYGRTLLLKVGVTLGVLALGALNWRKGLPVLDTAEGAMRTRRRAWTEVGLAALVLVVTAVLTGTSMPEGVH